MKYFWLFSVFLVACAAQPTPPNEVVQKLHNEFKQVEKDDLVGGPSDHLTLHLSLEGKQATAIRFKNAMEADYWCQIRSACVPYKEWALDTVYLTAGDRVSMDRLRTALK